MNITKQNAIRYQIDRLSAHTQGVVVMNTGAGFNCLTASVVTGFTVSASEPSGTKIFYVFNTGDEWFSLSTAGYAQNFPAGTLDFETIQTYGNTTGELTLLTNVPAFVGKIVRVAVALYAQDITQSKPALNKLAVNFRNTSQQLAATSYSAVYDLGDEGQIASCNADTEATPGSKVNVLAQITRPDGTVTEWLPLNKLAGVNASKIQFRGDFSVDAVNSGTSQINRVDLVYSDSVSAVTGSTDTEIYSITEDWYMPIKQCRLTLRHSPLVDSDITCYLSLRNAPLVVNDEYLGIATGSRKTFQLSYPEGVKYDTVKVYVAGQQIYTGFDVNTEVGRVTLEAEEGSIITADYESGWENETWQKMELTSRETLPDYDQSEYRLAILDNTKSVSSLRIAMNMRASFTSQEDLGTSTGIMQTFRLEHLVQEGRITLFADNEALPGSEWILLDDARYVRVNTEEGKKITARYYWVSEAPVVYQFAGVFAE